MIVPVGPSGQTLVTEGPPAPLPVPVEPLGTSQQPQQQQQSQPRHKKILYRYRTFAERLGPSNAKSILLHYLGVLSLAGSILKIRDWVIKYGNTCDDPVPTVPEPTDDSPHYSAQKGIPWWYRALCTLRGSDNFLIYYIRCYLDFSSYYVTLFVAAANTLVILVLAKHLYRAFSIKEEKKVKKKRKNSGSSGCPQHSLPVNTEPQCSKKSGSVAINMNCVPELEGCIDDNFCIEVILAAFDFFRVSETKQD